MASYARDIYFGVRVEDRATRPLRRIARDMKMLGKQGLIQRQTVARRSDLAASRAQNTRRAAAQEYLAAKRAYDLDVKRAQLAIKRAAEAKRTALLNQRLAKSAVASDVQAATTRAENAQLARRRAANQYLDKRSGTARIAQAQREAQFIDQATQARLKSAGVLKSLNALERQRIGIVTQVQQAELALAQRTGTALGKKFEANLAQAATINPRVLSRSGRGILMSGLSVEQLKNKIKSLGIAQGQLVRDEDVLAQKAGLASGALNKQRLAADRLAASEAKLNAETAGAAARFRTSSVAARQAAANVPVVEAAAQAKLTSTTKNLTLARQRYNLAVDSGAVIEANASARMARSSNTLRTASDGYRLARQRAAELNQEVGNFRIERLKGIATYIRHIGAVLTTVGAVGVFAFAFLAKGAADFSTQATLAATQSTVLGENTVKQVQKNSAFIQREIQKLLASGKVIAKAPEQTAATYQIFSGLTLDPDQETSLKQGIMLLKQFNRVATANVGLVTLEEATKAGIILINDFNLSLDQVPENLNTMQAAVRFGRMTMSEFIATLNQAAPAAKAAGYSFADMASAMAFLSRKFPSLRMGAAGYARLTEILARDDVVQGLKKQGVAATDLQGKLLPLDVIVGNVVKRYPELVKGGTALQNFFKDISGQTGTIQARRAFTFIAQDLPGYQKILRDVKRDHDELQKSFKAAQRTPSVRWAEFTNQLKALAIEIGTGVIPAIAALADQGRGAADWFNKLSPHTKRMIGYFGIMASAAVLLSGILFTLVGGAMALGLAITSLAGLFGGAGVAAGGLAASAGFMNPILGVALAAVAALGFALYKYPDQVKRVALATKDAARAFIPFISTLWQMIRVGARFTIWLLQVSNQLLLLTGKAWNIVVNIVSKVPGSSAAKKILGDFWNGFKNQPEIMGARAAVMFVKAFNKNKGNIPSIPLGTEQTRLGGLANVKKQVDLVRQAKEYAAGVNVPATKSFIQLYKSLVLAREEMEKHPHSIKASLKYYKILAEMQDTVTKEQYKAAQAAANNAARDHQKYSDAIILAEGKKVARLRKLAEKEKTFAAWKAYYSALNKLQNRATDSQLQAVQQLFDTTVSAAKKTTDKAKAEAKKMQDIYKDVLANVKQSYDSFLQQNQSAFGTLFSGPYMKNAITQDRLAWGQKLKPYELIKDLRQQVNAFAKYRKDIATLQKRGLPKSLIDEIMKLGPEQAGQQIALLKKMTPAQIAEYKALWNKGQADIHKATMRDLNKQINDWRKHGRRIALAIARGLRDENVALQAALKSMIEKAFPGLKTPNGGNNDKPAGVHSSIKSAHGSTSAHFNYGASQGQDEKETFLKEEHTHYHITTTTDPKDAKKQIKEANFHHRTRQ